MASSERGADGRGVWSRVDRVAFAILLVCLGAGLATLVHPWYDRTTDGSIYLLTSRALAAGEGYTHLGQPFRLRPPGLPLLLTPFVAGDEIDFRGVNLLVASFGAAALALLFVWVRPRLGGILALAITLAIAALPGFQRLCNQPMSDAPGAALLIACVLVERWASRAPSWRREAALGVLLGLSAYVRNGMGLLVLAILACRIAGRVLGSGERAPWPAFVRSRLAVFALVAWLVMLPWDVRNRLSPPELPVDQTWQHSAWTLLWHEDQTDPASPRFPVSVVVGRMLERLPAIPAELGKLELARGGPREKSVPATPLQRGFGLFLGACLIAAWIRRREPAETFLLLNALALAAFPMEILERYMLPFLAFALPEAVELVRAGLGRVLPSRIAQGLVAAALLAWAGLSFAPRSGWASIEREHTTLASLAKELARELPQDARLAAPIGWHLEVYLGRPVYSLLIACSVAGTPEAGEAVIDRYRLDTIVLLPNDAPNPMEQRLGYFARKYPGARTVSVPGASARILRVRP